MLLLIGKFACFVLCYAGGLVGGVFLHELGHAAMALLATGQRVEMEVGTGGRRGRFPMGRLQLNVRSKGLRYGATRYERYLEPRRVQALVAAGGPLASLLGCLGFAWLTVSLPAGSWAWIGSFALALANFRILMVALWPWEYRPGGGDEIWPSDGLDLWRLWRFRSD